MRLPVSPVVTAAPALRLASEPSRGIRDLSPPGSFARHLRRERARADRSGREFTVVILRPADGDESRSVFRLARALARRARETDEIGWLDECALYALLPETTAAGAWHLAEDVCGAVEKRMGRPTTLVYTYPTLGKSDASAERPIQMPVRHDRESRPPLKLHRDDLLPFVMQGFAEEMRAGRANARPLYELLVRPMPLWKRAMDVLGASVGLLLLLPLFAMVAAAIKFTSRGPVIFRQVRSGRGGIPFVLYKFRTMVVDAEARKRELRERNEQDGPAFKMKNDPRVTRLGRILRATSVDELPQLWNVLKGEMTLVGPRPLPISETEACLPWHHRRLDVTPGLTCVWQVKGRSRVTFDQWVRMDVQYIRSQTILQDLKIILQTIPAVLWKRTGR